MVNIDSIVIPIYVSPIQSDRQESSANEHPNQNPSFTQNVSLEAQIYRRRIDT